MNMLESAEERVNGELDRLLSTAMQTAMARATQENCSLKEAAFVIALERLV